jgi:hypothetical protein
MLLNDDNELVKKVEVYNLQGTRIIETPESLAKDPINISFLKTGVYLVTVATSSKVHSFKLFKQ